jgi:PAS domain S-box-containing protein
LNPFIKGKFVQVFLISLAISILAITYLSYNHYTRLKNNAIANAFDTEALYLNGLESQYIGAKALMKSAAEVLLEEMTSRTNIENNDDARRTPIVQSLTGRNYSFRSTNSSIAPHYVLNQSENYLQAFKLLKKSDYIKSVALIARVNDVDFQVVEPTDSRISSSILNWIEHSEQTQSPLPLDLNAIYSPPFLDQGALRNYILVQLPVTNSQPVFIIGQLNETYLKPKKLSGNYIVWQQGTKRVVASNMYIDINMADNIQSYLATRYLPDAWHAEVFEEIPQTGQVKIKQIDDSKWLFKLSRMQAAPFSVLFFREATTTFDHVHALLISEVIKLTFISCICLTLFLLVIFIGFARPISSLLFFVEKQNSFYEIEHVDPPLGWELWFDKIGDSFKENRKLFNALVRKNRQLDEKITKRTIELQQQTKSKDRNLALNRAIINSLPDMIYYKNIDGSYVGCNNAFEKLCGVGEAKLVTKLSEDVFEDTIAEQLTQFDYHALHSQRLFSGKVWHKANGGQIFVNWLVTPIVNSEGEMLGTVGVGRDITQREIVLEEIQSAKETAEEANRIKTEFIANMSHEIRTPINAITGMLDLLHSTAPTPIQKSYVDVASASSKHLLQVINELLDFSRLNAGMMELSTEEFDLNDVVSVAFANSLPTAIDKELLLDVDIPLDFPTKFIGDKVRLSQVFTNLINNAVKFTKQGKVSFSAKLKSTTSSFANIEFNVTDTGCGIPKDKQQTIFEAFSQVDSSNTRRFGGTGLGLAIVFQIVDLMEGKIDVASEIDVGTTFKVTVKLKLDSKALRKQKSNPLISSLHWVLYEPNKARCDYLAAKLERTNQSYSVNTFDFDNKKNVTLLCRPNLLNELEPAVISQLKSGFWNYQPVIFDVSHLAKNQLQELTFYPILTMPFSDRDLVENQLAPMDVNMPPSAAQEFDDIFVLVVEDNDVNQQVVSLMLDSVGIKHDIAENGLVGLTLMADNHYDAVLLDIQMPVMDGITMAKKLRAQSQFATIPLVAMSANTSNDSNLRSVIAGIDVHLNKPVEKSELLKTLSQLILRSKSPQDKKAKSLENKRNALSDDKNQPDIKAKSVSKKVGVDLSKPELVLDESDLLNQVGNNEDIMLKLINVFVSTKKHVLYELLDELDISDHQTLFAKFHNFEGMLANIRAKEAVRHLCLLRLAIKSSTSDRNEYQSVANGFKTALDELFDELEYKLKINKVSPLDTAQNQ